MIDTLKLPEKRIVDDYVSMDDTTTVKLAKKYYCSPSTIRKILLKNKVPEEIRQAKKKVPEPKRRFDDKMEKNIVDLYVKNKHISTRDLAKRYHCSSTTIARIIEKWHSHGKEIKLKKKGSVGIRKFSFEKEKDILKEYLESFISIGDLATKCDCSRETISALLKRHHVSKNFIEKRARKISTKKITHPIPKSAKELNYDKGWIIGVLVGDGCFDKKRGRMILESGYKNPDIDFLQLWKETIKGVYELDCSRRHKNRKLVGFTLSSRSAINDLIKYEPFGTYNWRIPKEFFNLLDASKGFLQGFLDSEACVYNRGISIKSVNENGLKQIKKLLNKFNVSSNVAGPSKELQMKCLKCKKRLSKNKNYCIFCGDTSLIPIYREYFMLIISDFRSLTNFQKNINFRLSRKKEKLSEVLKRNPRFIRMPEERKDKIIQILNENNSTVKEISSITGYEPSIIGYHIRKLEKGGKIRKIDENMPYKYEKITRLAAC